MVSLNSDKLDMKSFILPFLILFSVQAASREWKSIIFNDKYFLENTKNPEIRIKVSTIGGGVKFESVEKTKNKDIVLLIYNSGSAGTSEIINQRRAVIFHKKTKKKLGDFAWKLKSDNPKSKPLQPKWTFKKSQIIVDDPNTGIVKTINF